ncbi:hypothetical protein [Ancylobacter terrae]|uniref:hypothetical protein n=1 Tax=Ancylobacter sp. sgz301288 TaxID=3342077 RepID=UPI00385D0D2A
MRGRNNEARRSGVRRAVGAALAIVTLAASSGSGQAASFLEKNFWLSGPNYSGDVPACDTPQALSRIADRFHETMTRFWNANLTLDSFDRVHQIAFRPWGEEYQPRRYCSARVFVANGPQSKPMPHTVYYSIIEDGGYIGFSWGVEWCVVGLDKGWGYTPNCKMARP